MLPWGTQSMSWREKRSAADILVSAPHTPQIPNGPHDMQLQSNIWEPVHVVRRGRRREEEVKLGFIGVEVEEEVRQGRRGGCVCASCWKPEDRPGCSVHFITLFSSRGPGVCRSTFCGQQSARWLDELHLSKWMLLISTPCYMDHLRTWWV